MEMSDRPCQSILETPLPCGMCDTVIDPLHVCGNAANLEDKTKEIFASVKKSYCSVLQIGCIPTDMQGVYRTTDSLNFVPMLLLEIWVHVKSSFL